MSLPIRTKPKGSSGAAFTFMTHLVQDFGVPFGSVKGISVDEATAVYCACHSGTYSTRFSEVTELHNTK